MLAEFGKYCEKRQQEVGIRITQLTANKYHRLLRYMTESIRDIYHKEDLPLETVDYAYVDGLNTCMQTAYSCHNNGAVNLPCCLKNFLLYTVRNEWIEKNPFRYYKMKIDMTNVKVPLTKVELDLLLKRPMPNERLDRIRDVFCFCASTGCIVPGILSAQHIPVKEIHMNTKKILVAFFSRPGENYAVGYIEQGNTHIVAEMIAYATGGTLFRIEPSIPYPDDYRACTDVAQQEKRSKARPALVRDIAAEEYDVIFLGYLNWWGRYADARLHVPGATQLAG